MSQLKLFVLGPPRVELDGAPVEFQRRKALALLVYLAVSRQPHTRDALATLLWPDQPQRRARAYLRRDLAVLNTSLAGEWLIADRETIELKGGAAPSTGPDVEPETRRSGQVLWLDVTHFRQLLAACGTHDHPPEEVCAECLPLLSEAVALYTDDFLAGFTLRDSAEFDDWQFFQTESLRQELASVLERLVQGQSARGEYAAAIPAARRWLALDPLHEPAQRQLMQLYDQSGQPAAALRQYEEYVALLEEELGLPPEEETTTLYEAIKAKRILGPFIKAEMRASRLDPRPSSPLPSRGQDREAEDKEAPLPSTASSGANGARRDAQIGQGAKELAETRGLVQIYMLGRFEIMRGESVLPAAGWSNGKPAALLQRLLLEQRLTRDEAIDFLRSVSEPDSGAEDLDETLSVLRQTLDTALGPDTAQAIFSFEDGALSLNESVWVDVHEFERLCSDLESPTANSPRPTRQPVLPAPGAQAPWPAWRSQDGPWPAWRSQDGPWPAWRSQDGQVAHASAPGGRQLSASNLQQALSLYQGDLLPEVLDVEWILTRREALRRLQREATVALAVYQRDAHDYGAAIALLRPMLIRDSADEPIHRELMCLYALDGHRHEALRQYQACVEALATERPDPETEALYRQIVNGQVAPPLLAATPKLAWLPPAAIASEVERALPLVGREDELETLQTKIHTGWQGQGSTILLAGDSGMGKTRLAYEALRAAALSRMTTLAGAAYEQEARLPYQPFIEAFDRYLTEQRRPLEHNPITHFQPSDSRDSQQEHSALFKAVTSFLTALATRAPVILLLDDLHAADEASLSLFHYLARHTRSAPVILLATYRTDTAVNGVSPFGSLINALYREHLSQVLHLTPLSEHAAANIIAHTLGGEADPGLVNAILGIAEGNPFFIQEITLAMLKADRLNQDNGRWHLSPGATLRVPSGLRELLRERVQRLGPTVESALAAAAVVGREFRFTLLQEVAGLPDAELLDALDAALASHLLEELEDGYRFRHSLIRHTLYDALSRARRAWLHARAAEAMETTYAAHPEGLKPHVEALAFHYELSDHHDRALPYLLQAGQKAANVYALEVASDYFERALALMNDLDINDPAQRWPILEQLGRWALVLADTPRAVARFEEALALTPTQTWQPGLKDRARLHRLAARALITVGDAAAAEQHLRAALEEMDETQDDSIDYAFLLYDVALWHWHRNEYREAFQVAQHSLDIAERLNDSAALARAYEMLALASHSLGDWQQGLNFEEQRSALVGSNLDVTEAFDVHL